MDRIEQMLRRLVAEGDAGIAKPRSEEEIKEVECALGVVFPDSYRQFIRRCGAAVIGDSNFLGIWTTPLGEDGSGTYWHTRRCREEYELPRHYVVVCSDQGDEILWCLDTQRIDSNNECFVVQFNIEDSTVEHVSDGYGAMLSEYLDAFLRE